MLLSIRLAPGKIVLTISGLATWAQIRCEGPPLLSASIGRLRGKKAPASALPQVAGEDGNQI